MSNYTELDDLIISFKDAKEAENLAKQERITIEESIYTLTKGDFKKTEGTNNISGEVEKMSVTVGFYLKFDQTELDLLYKTGTEVEKSIFPFKQEWKCDVKMLKNIQQTSPELYKKIQTAMTVTPKKPSFKVK